MGHQIIFTDSVKPTFSFFCFSFVWRTGCVGEIKERVQRRRRREERKEREREREMGKHDFLTPKAIANRIKSKGLQKLRWYCQMCQKQCRDENGFKCHCMSESHQRQMQIVSQNPNKFLSGFSESFKTDFLDVLWRRHGSKRVRATKVWTEYIADRDHIHMNSTVWVTLTNFVKFLGREGICKVDQDEEGKWYMAYLYRDPEVLKRQEALAKKEKMNLDDEERQMRLIRKQQAKVGDLKEEGKSDDTDDSIDEEKTKLDFEQKPQVKLSIGSGSKRPLHSRSSSFQQQRSKNVFLEDEEEEGKEEKGEKKQMRNAEEEEETSSSFGSRKRKGEREGSSNYQFDQNPQKKSRKMSAVEEIVYHNEKKKQAQILREQQQKEKEYESNRFDYWLTPGIIVKIMHKSLGDGSYYKKKAEVVDVVEKYGAILRVLDNGHKIKLDQDDLETVLPSLQGKVIVLNGTHRHRVGVLVNVNLAKFSATVRLSSGSQKGKEIEFEYEDISKLVEQ